MSKTTGSQRAAWKRVFERSRDSVRAVMRFASDRLVDRIARAMMWRQGERPVSAGTLPLKHERLRQLLAAGFNVADHRAWLRGHLVIDELDAMLAKHGALSLRNFTEESAGPEVPSPRLPVLYEQGDRNIVRDFCKEHNVRYHTLVNEAIPRDDSLYTGNIVLLDRERYAISYFSGKGTPRDIETKLDQDPVKVGFFIRMAEISPPLDAPDKIREIGKRALSLLPGIRPMTVEFSIYPYPIGALQRPEIFWEWRAGSGDDLFKMMGELCKRLSEAEFKAVLSEVA